MVLSCTKKILGKIGKYKTVESDKEELGFHNWYVDLINLERKNYFLFTNSKTLFSFFIYVGTKKELINLEYLFEAKLKEQIAREVGANPKYLENLFTGNKKYRFLKTNSRSILGSMNEIKFQIRVLVHHKGELKNSYDLVNHLINEVPMGALKYEQPIEVMKKELASLIK